MKVACIFNMNNNFYALTRYLRDRGIDAHLILLNNEVPHFHPSADCYDLSYQEYTHSVNWGAPFAFGRTSNEVIKKDLSGYDFIICCGIVPAFLEKIGKKLDLFIPFGADLYEFLKFKISNKKMMRILLTQYPLLRSQRSGIKKTRYIITDLNLGGAREGLKKLGFLGKVFEIGIPMLYTPVYNPQSISRYYNRSYWAEEFKQIRANHDLIVFHHARHVWKTCVDDISWKNNDRVINGFAQFIKLQKAETKACLIMIEYGPDVNNSKALVASLNIQKNVRWFPMMSRKDIMTGLSLCDIGTGDFHMGSIYGGVNYEVLAMAKPFLHFRNDDYYKDYGHELYPLMNAKTADDITSALVDYKKRPDSFKEMGEQGRKWLQKYAIDIPLDRYLSIINEQL